MAIIYASVSGGPVRRGNEWLKTFKLQTAVNRMAPGDELEILPGHYIAPILISISGTEEKPLTLRASAAGGVVFDGQTAKEAAIGKFEPMDDDFAFISIMGANWVNLVGIKFQACWPSAIFIRGSKHITIADCTIHGGRFAVYARNRRWFGKARHITLERVTWVQDPDHDMWAGRVTWPDVKQEPPTDTDASFFNGALFGSFDIKGPVTVRDCDVSHAFNVVRMDGKSNTLGRGRNTDIVIKNNRFRYIRDNAVEPEKVAERLYVIDNDFHNVHAAFSLDGVGGRHWYFIGNRVLNTEKPGLGGQANRGGKIFKFDDKPPFPQEAFYVAFNSVQTRTGYIKSGETRFMHHANNAVGICRDGPDCDLDRKMYGEEFQWHSSLNFTGDLCDHPEFPDTMRGDGFLVSGIQAPHGTFAPAVVPAELTLRENSPGRGGSEVMTVRLPDGQSVTIPAGRDIGYPAPEPLASLPLIR